MIDSLRMVARLATGLPGFLRNPITLADARDLVARGLQSRDRRFLKLVERAVIGRPQSPYARLLREARCEMADLRQLVEREGLRAALQKLREAGVYVSFEEFKGREPIRRGSLTFEVKPGDFQNPFLRASYESSSGGSTGAGTRVHHDLDHLALQSAHLMLLLWAHGVLGAPAVLWRGVLPDASGLSNILRNARFGHPIAKWYSPNDFGEKSPAPRFQLATYGTVFMSYLAGRPLCWPEKLPIRDGVVIAKWIRRTLDEHGVCVLNTAVSRALRVSIAAREAALDLTGAHFQIAGEPPTEAKVAGIHACGARHFTTYGFNEGGRVALGCAKPASLNDLHVISDAFEVFSCPRQAPGSSGEITALNVTSLAQTTPQILINAESDDFGIVEERRCGCPLDELGYHTHVRDIHSFRKLTGEGVTLVGSEMVDIIERILPEKFGGTALDFQLAEEEDEQGFTRLSIYVHPRLNISDEAEVARTILDRLEAGTTMSGRAQAIWRQAGTLRVKRKEPVWTARGKLLPLYLNRPKV